MKLRILCALLLALLGAAGLRATVYEVGPGQPLATIGAVPWATLGPGDRVLIHWQNTPYREKWVLNRRGTAQAPIVIAGVPGPGGELPVISGENATTAPGLNFWNDERGLIKIGGSNVPADGLPGYLVISGLDLRSARPPFTFTDDGAQSRTYAANAAAIYVEKAEHLTVRGCILSDSGNGLFVGAFDGATQDIRIEGNWIYGNGNVGSAFEHNTYTAAIGILYRGNRFGPLRAGANGNNLKDRSAGLVVESNWIEGGNRQLDLVDAEDSMVLVNHPSYHTTFVYGNVLIENDADGNSQIVHYGGDSGDTTIYRKGTLYFYNNTLISKRSGNTTLLRLSTNDEHADVRNNLLYVTAAGNRLAMLDADGVLDLTHNWLKPGWVASHSGLSGVIHDDGSSVLAASPGFLDEAAANYRPAASSTARNAAGALASAVLPAHDLLTQYFEHQRYHHRPGEGALDIGAFEHCPAAGLCEPIALQNFENGDTGSWLLGP